MILNNQLLQPTNVRRQTLTLPTFPIEEEYRLVRRLSGSANLQHRLPTVPRISLPYVNEYRSQERVPPGSADLQRQVVLSRLEDSNRQINRSRLSVISEDYTPLVVEEEEEESEWENVSNEVPIQTESHKRRRRILFLVEPIIVGFILLPIIALFWDCGWNLTLILLDKFNGHPLTLQVNSMKKEEPHKYPLYLLVIPYLGAQILLLILYLSQDFFYNFLQRQNRIITMLLLKCHIFVLASTYIVQWEMLWIMWDQYTPRHWYFELVLSLAALLALIVLIGNLSDLVCAPFLVSYDSIEYCLHFGCPLMTRAMKQWQIYLINYVLYEIIISNIAILTWRGFYNVLDRYVYRDDIDKSAWICLLIGYILYFPLMYFQDYLEHLNSKFEFWVFVSINFPQLYGNVRHLVAFISCIFLWRGLWLLYDTHVIIFELHYRTYLLLYLLSFFFLAVIQTSSSTNGPLSNMEDENRFFPLYPNCYVSIVVRKFSWLSFCR